MAADSTSKCKFYEALFLSFYDSSQYYFLYFVQQVVRPLLPLVTAAGGIRPHPRE